MENIYFEQPKKKKSEEPEKSFFQEFFSFTSDGKIKSLDLLYALALSFVFLFFYFGVQHFLTLWFEELFVGASRALLNLLDIGVSAILATAVLCVIDLFLKNKRLFPTAFIFALITEIVVILYILISYPTDTRALILPAVLYMLLLPTLFGAGIIFLETYLFRKKAHKDSAK